MIFNDYRSTAHSRGTAYRGETSKAVRSHSLRESAVDGGPVPDKFPAPQATFLFSSLVPLCFMKTRGAAPRGWVTQRAFISLQTVDSFRYRCLASAPAIGGGTNSSLE